MFVPVKFDADRTHHAKWALNYEASFIDAVTEAPLDLMFEAHFVIGVDAVLGRPEVFW